MIPEEDNQRLPTAAERPVLTTALASTAATDETKTVKLEEPVVGEFTRMKLLSARETPAKLTALLFVRRLRTVVETRERADSTPGLNLARMQLDDTQVLPMAAVLPALIRADQVDVAKAETSTVMLREPVFGEFQINKLLMSPP